MADDSDSDTTSDTPIADHQSPFTEEQIDRGLNGEMFAQHLGLATSSFQSYKAKGKVTADFIREKTGGELWRFDRDARWDDDKRKSAGGLWFRVE